METEDQDTPYTRYKKDMGEVFYEIKHLEQHINDVVQNFNDAQRAHAAGVQNVYDKFMQLEKRQLAIEELLKSDRITDMLKAIPNEQAILKMFDMIDNHPLNDIKEKIADIRDDLEELTDKFTL